MEKRHAISGLRISRQDMSLLIRGAAIDVAAHRHHALQVSIGCNEPLDFECEGRSISTAGIVTAPDVEHRLDSRGHEVAVLLLEPEQLSARRIGAAWLGQRPFSLLPDHVTNKLRKVLAGKNTVDAFVGALLPDEEPFSPSDSRISLLLSYLHNLPEKRVSLGVLAKKVGLSESRLSHLFKQETGVAVRRYLLWLCLNDAMDRAMGGASLTEAAHGAGFSDSAHLTRTCRAMFGINPFAVLDSRFVQAPKGDDA
ncbi:AraC family transcriptional regulator [Parvibaculum sp.]|uniref:AraC family transcriptional regulator n=2 Tax=Parvibaculum sp. TaxID=2024848 RepID=UPI001B19910B|nr:AraC family transcriptional regulator [Parvibaculum sp.]MBO6678547.1 helix-turn-helix transcriptional regulator [Parvibaculum sp.]MBO6686529.1 helix-turn-helix transcriptional regulator [Parvibaculum sp.]MBO6903740.1 helix-turn-helix transcriptional regulator [Parvibaculum sp.]